MMTVSTIDFGTVPDSLLASLCRVHGFGWVVRIQEEATLEERSWLSSNGFTRKASGTWGKRLR